MDMQEQQMRTRLEYFRNIDNTMRNFDEIVALWKEAGIDLDNNLSFMCGSGWRAAEVLMYANVYGLKDVSLYSDGWIGWSNNPSNPVETGETEGIKSYEKTICTKWLLYIITTFHSDRFNNSSFCGQLSTGTKAGVYRHMYTRRMQYMEGIYNPPSIQWQSIIVACFCIILFILFFSSIKGE